MSAPSRTTLLVVRHGETVWNKEERFQGHEDSPLTATGRAQARAVGERLEKIPFDAMISSDLGRAKETAGIIAEITGRPFGTDSRLRERNFGVLEGLTLSEIRAQHPGILEALYADAPDYAPPGGESLRTHYHRNIAFLEAFMTRQEGTTTVLVVHGGVLDSLFRFVTRIPLEQPRPFITANAGLSQIVHGSFYGTTRWVIETWGEASHLDGVGRALGLG